MAKGKKSSNGLDWHKSGAYTPDKFPGQKCMSDKRANHMGEGSNKQRMSSAHGTGMRGKHHQLHSAENALGSSVRTFNKGLPKKAPAHISGSGSKHSRDLG